MRVAALVVVSALCACSNETPSASTTKGLPSSESTAAPASQHVVQDGQTFGAPVSTDVAFVPLEQLLENPKAWDGKHVRTRGEVTAVCQNAGCWADLRPVEDVVDIPKFWTPVHVTMHGHAFFLPKTAKSKVAEVEGTLSVRALTQDECDHFNSEGAALVAGAPVLGVDATGVVLR